MDNRVTIAAEPASLPPSAVFDFDPSQGRDDSGKWTKGSGGGGAATVGSGATSAKPSVAPKGLIDPSKVVAAFKTGAPGGNLTEAVRALKAGGLDVVFGGQDELARSLGPGHDNAIATYNYKDGKIYLNPRNDFWDDPTYESQVHGEFGEFSTGDSDHALRHEAAHALHHQRVGDARIAEIAEKEKFTSVEKTTAKKVSKYAAGAPGEFVAETYVGTLYGKKYPADVMALYAKFDGPPLPKKKEIVMGTDDMEFSAMDDHGIATFDLPAPVSQSGDDTGFVVYPDSLLMTAGDYSKDKGIDLSPDDLKRAVRDFTGPIPNVIDHVGTKHGIDTIFDGKLGEVRRIWTEDGGKKLKGEVAIPRWLDAVWGAAKKVSTEWHPTAKTLGALGLVVRPYIKDAALMAAFSAVEPETVAAFAAGERTYEGASSLQSLHDQAARSGAICSSATARKAGDPYFNTSAEAEAIQRIHDAAIKGGAKCKMLPEPRGDSYGPVSAFAAARTSEAAAAVAQKLHDSMGKEYPDLCNPKSKAVRFDGADDGNANGDGDGGRGGPGRGDYPRQAKRLQGAHDELVSAGATCPGRASKATAGPKPAMMGSNTPPAEPGNPRTAPARGGGMRMAWRETLAAIFNRTAEEIPESITEEGAKAGVLVLSGDGVITEDEPADPETQKPEETDVSATVTETPPPAPVSFGETPDGKALLAKIADLEERDRKHAAAEAARTEAELKHRAATFAAELATGDPARKILPRITPAAQDAVAAIFEQAARDDAANAAVVTFSVGADEVKGGRVDGLKAMFAALPGHDLLGGQKIAPGGVLREGLSVFSRDDDAHKPMTPDRKKQLLQHAGINPAASNGTA